MNSNNKGKISFFTRIAAAAWRIAWFLNDFFPDPKPHNRAFRLLISFYEERSPERVLEFKRCLRINLKNLWIRDIHVFYENRTCPAEGFLNHPRVKIYDYRSQTDRGAAYERLISFANKNFKNENIIIANTDIFFDGTLAKLRDYDLSNRILALTRYNCGFCEHTDGTQWPRHAASQDSWIFKAPLKEFYSNFFMGWEGCDNRLAYEAHKAGIQIYNPCKDIKTWHLHNHPARPYKVKKQTYILDWGEFIQTSMVLPFTTLKKPTEPVLFAVYGPSPPPKRVERIKI